MHDSFCVASEVEANLTASKSKRGVVMCDETCLGWKSQMCSNVLPVVEKMRYLDETIQG